MTRDLHPDAKTDLHPDAAQFLRDRQDRSGLHEIGAKAARRQQRQGAGSGDDPEPVGSVEDVVVRSDGHGVGVRLYVPEGSGPFPTLVWAHGGGFVLGDIETEDPVGRALTNATDCLVASVDYRLAPEHKFPAALRDVYAVTEWASEEIGAYGGDPDRAPADRSRRRPRFWPATATGRRSATRCSATPR